MTKCVTDVGGNVGESQAAKIGSHFSLVMLISVPGGKIDSLSDQLKNMSDMNANLYVLDNLSQPEPSKIGCTFLTNYEIQPIFFAFFLSSSLAASKLTDTGLFTLEGADNPGLVHKVTTILSENGLSIDKMSTSDEIAPHGGTVLFKMQGTAHAYEPLAAGFNAAKIKEELVTLGHNLNCDINMEDVED